MLSTASLQKIDDCKYNPLHLTSRYLQKSCLTVLLLNTTCPVLANSVDPDQLASEEADRDLQSLNM